MERNGKKFEDPSETPEEIVGLLGNFGNRPDCRTVQERQVKEIKALMKEARDLINTFPIGHTRSCSFDNSSGDEGDYCDCGLRERRISIRKFLEKTQ